jgi:hypothetical protein
LVVVLSWWYWGSGYVGGGDKVVDMLVVVLG